MFRSAFLILILFPLCAFSAEKIKGSPFTALEKGYSLTFPDGWHWHRQSDGPIDVTAVLVSDSDWGYMSISTDKLDMDFSAKEYAQMYYEELLNDNLSARKGGKVVVDGVEGRQLFYPMKDETVKVTSYFVIKNGYCYILTFATTTTQFDKFKKTIDEVLSSFKFRF